MSVAEMSDTGSVIGSARSLNDYLRLAVELRTARRFDEAEELLAEAVERFPGETRPRIEWALVAHVRRDWPEAARRWEIVRAAFPDEPAAHALGGNSLRELGRDADAERLLSTALVRFPDDVGIANEHAWLATLRRDWPTALRRWELMRDMHPERIGGYTGVAMILRELGRFEEAEAALTRTIDLFSDQAGPRVDYARIAEARGDWAEAARRWETVRARFPDQAAGYISGAVALRELARLDDAEALLETALDRFPEDSGAAIEYAWAAHRRRDWREAARRWDLVRERFPDYVAGYTGAAGAHREGLNFDEAEALASQAVARFPNEPAGAIELAMVAHLRRDLPTAIARWQELRERFPRQIVGYTMGSLALFETNRDDEAEALLRQALERFPGGPEPLIEYARVAERRRKWPAAIERWEQVRARFADRVEGHLGGALALIFSSRHDEAERLLEHATARFPQAPQIACEHAWIAYRRHRWDEAEQRFALVRERFPLEPAGYRGGAEVLIHTGRLNEAEALLDVGIERIPTDPLIAYQRALLPAAASLREARDWETALLRLAEVCARFPDFEQAHVGRSRMLRERGRLDEAEAVAEAALQRRARSAELGIEYARIAQEKGGWPEALKRYRAVTERFPDQAAGYIGHAEALSQLGRFDEAESLLERALAAFPAEVAPYAEHARVAMRRGDPAEALRRWHEAVGRFPNDTSLAQELFVARLRAAETDPAIAAEVERADAVATGHSRVAAADDLPPMRELVGAFESLGGTLLGCEFGLFQRAHGAEPLGLLRWTDMEPEGLLAALEAEFEGVGLPENTELLSPPGADNEYGTRDRRFGMRMHTFVPMREMPADKMFAQVCRRLQFLRDKLVADLRSEDKLFVFKITARNLAEEELRRIRAAMRSYGDNTLYYVRYADPQHPAGTVEMTEPGLLIGYLDRFAMSASGEDLGAQTVAWTEICQKAYRLWRRASQGAANGLNEAAGSPSQDGTAPREALSPGELVMQFESLGGSGHGCEFGIFQREFGAEPLGLLRWADLNHDALTAALETDFDGVGVSENTELFVPSGSDRPEYWTRDHRYWMAMRTFVPADEVPEAEMRERVCRRLQFLKRKLIEDLAAGSKIFVYKVLARNLSDAELARIHNAMRRYGDNTLLYVRYADDQHPNGTVQLRAPGLLIGYIDRFSHSPEDEHLGSATPSWLAICGAAYRLWPTARGSATPAA